MFADDKGIKNLSNLENAVNLQILSLNNNQISDISPLKNLPNLKELRIKGNPIADTKQIDELKSAGVEVEF
jgi:Leucine-rich repeat (LRR) protein